MGGGVMKKNISLLLLSVILASCASIQRHWQNFFNRTPASEDTPIKIADDNPSILYFTYGQKDKTKNKEMEVFDSTSWKSKSAAERTQRMIEFQAADSYAASFSGLVHQACFMGSAQAVRDEFITGQKFDNIQGQVDGMPSSDQKMLGVQFTTRMPVRNRQTGERSVKTVARYFRMP